MNVLSLRSSRAWLMCVFLSLITGCFTAAWAQNPVPPVTDNRPSLMIEDPVNAPIQKRLDAVPTLKVERVYANPEEFNGKIVAFDNLTLSGHVQEHVYSGPSVFQDKEVHGRFELTVITPNGNQFGPKGYSDSLHFMASADTAAKFAKVGLKADKYYSVKLTCWIVARGLGVRGYRFLANVLRVEFFANPRPASITASATWSR